MTGLLDVCFPVTAVVPEDLSPGGFTDVVRALAAVDRGILMFLWENFPGPRNEGPSWGSLTHALLALDDGLAGRRGFHKLYPLTAAYASYLGTALHTAIKGRLMSLHTMGGRGPRWDRQMRGDCKSVEKHAERLRKAVLERKRTVIKEERIQWQCAIEARWRILVDIVDAIYCGSEMKRVIVDWDGFFSSGDALLSGVRSDVSSLGFGPHLDIAAPATTEPVRASSGDMESAGQPSSARIMAFSKVSGHETCYP